MTTADLTIDRADPPASWWRCHPVFILTFIGAALRLWQLDQPALWYDEGMTFARSSGSYAQMLGSLEDAGFSPLHYETYWALSRFFWMTPFLMRMVPALCGIAMIPAMYHLARHFVRKPTACAVAAFTTFSAFLLNYSRDAKMYMDLWLFCVLTTCCYLSFLRSGSYLSLLGWIAAGLAMVGLHAPGCILLALPPIFLLTRYPPPLRIWILSGLGLLLIASGPLGYYSNFSHFLTSEDRSLNTASGTTWVPGYNAGRSGGDQVLYGATAFLFGWEWPRAPIANEYDAQQDAKTRSDMLAANHLRQTAAIALFLIALLGMWPWKRAADLNARRDDSAALSTRAQSRLWLALWLIVPVYAFYCASVRGFDTPAAWIRSIGDLFGNHWRIVITETVLIALLCWFWNTASRVLFALLCLAPLIILNLTILTGGFPASGHFSPWRATFDARWFALAGSAFNLLTDPHTIAAALPIVAAVAFHRSGKHLGLRIWRSLGIGILVAILLGCCQVVALVVNKEAPTGSVWIPRYMGVCWPAFAIIVCALFDRLPHRTLAWSALALLLAANLVHYLNRFDATEPPIDRIAADLIDSDIVRHDPLGPAPVTQRIAKTNLAELNAAAGDSDVLLRNALDMPMILERGIIDEESVTSTLTWHKRIPTRTYLLNIPDLGPNPGQGGIDSVVGRYYLAILGTTVRAPADLRGMGGGAAFFDPWPASTPAEVAADVQKNPKLKTLIVWDYAIAIPRAAVDAIQLQLDRLKAGWQIESSELFTVEDHWSWHSRGTFRRRVYEIVPEPAKQNR